nr:SsgA family sporulation/cell division regulator [Saccharopolyspora phatthalungensis]
MASDHKTIQTATFFHLVAPASVNAPVGVELRYDSRNPYEVSMSFNTGKPNTVDWVFGRDLLADGLLADSGEGDVRISPRSDEPTRVLITLTSPSGQATFDADADLLAAFVDDSYEVVAPGDEHLFMNIDEALSQLMQHEL